MTQDSFPHNADPSGRPNLTEAEQRALLQPLLERNMQRLVANRELFLKLKQKHEEKHPYQKEHQGRNDTSLVVSRNRYGKRMEDDSWQDGEHLQVGFKSVFGDGASATSFVSVAHRIDTPEGTELVVEDEFTQEEGELVASMVDELMFAKLSGQIPDLHEMSLDDIYIPRT